MLLATVEYRSHALGHARIVVQEIFDARKVTRPLRFSVLEIVVASVADADIVGADLSSPMNFFFSNRPGTSKADVVAPRLSIVDRYVRMNFKPIELAGATARRHATENRHHKTRHSDILLVITVFAGCDQAHAKIGLFGFIVGRRIGLIEELILGSVERTMQKREV